MKQTRKSASVAELKARLSEFLALVKGGEEVIVTERNVPVARLSPLADRDLAVARTRELVRAGQLRPPRVRLPRDFMSRRLPADPDGAVLGEILRERQEGW
jgi:prevent-host-death family protein